MIRGLLSCLSRTLLAPVGVPDWGGVLVGDEADEEFVLAAKLTVELGELGSG